MATSLLPPDFKEFLRLLNSAQIDCLIVGGYAMRNILKFFRNVVLWNYRRTSWQYDVLCLLILAFVFLTPKSWFDGGELRHQGTHQNTRSPAVVLPIADGALSAEADMNEIENRARRVLNRPDARVETVRARRDASGRIVAYEVDIR